jgi:hypothetical protein
MKTLVLSLCLGISAAAANATDVFTTYNINFSGGSPNPTSGSFTWDSTTDQFTAFTVTFESTPFNLLSAANGPGFVTGCGTQAGTANTILGSALDSFDLMTNPGAACGSGTTSKWSAGSISGFAFSAQSSTGVCGGGCLMIIDDSETGSQLASGTWTASVTPEPGTLTSTIAGGALLLLAAWKRRRRGR